MNNIAEIDIFNLCPNPIFIIDNNGLIIKANKASHIILEFLNVHSGEILDKKWKNLFLSEDLKKKKFIKLNTGKFSYSLTVAVEGTNTVLYGENITLNHLALKKLQNINKNYKLIAHNATDIISRYSAEGIQLYVSPSCKTHMNYEAVDLLGKSVFDFIHPEDFPNFKDVFFKFNKIKEPVTISYRMKTQAGDYIWFESIFKRIRSKNEAFLEVLGVAREISERKKIEEELKESEELYKSVANSLTQGLMTLDLNGKITFMNSAMEKITETSKSWLLHKNLQEISLPDNAILIKERIEKIKKGSPVNYELNTRVGKEKIKWLEVNGAPRKNKSNNITGLIFSVSDITEKKNQEDEIAKQSVLVSKTDNGIVITNSERDENGNISSYFSIQKDTTEKIQTLALLKESEQRYKDLLSASFEGIVVHNQNKIIDCNIRFADILGYQYDELIGSAIQQYIPERYNEKEFNIEQSIEGSCEYIVKCKGGETLQVEINTKKHIYKNSTVLVTIIKDVTERIKTLQKLRESDVRYRDLVETSSNFIFTCNFKGYFIYVNSIGLRKLSYSQEEFNAMHYTDIIDKAWKEGVEEFYKNQFHNKIIESYYEFPVKAKDGSEIWLGQNVQLLQENNRISGFNGYASDITERKTIELELDRQKDLLKIILDTLPISVFLLNSSGEYLFVNNEGLKHQDNLIFITKKCVSKNSSSIFEEKITEDLKISEEKIFRDTTEEYILLGRKKIISELFTQSLTLGYFIDITDRKIAEKALMLAKSKAEETMMAKERFISIMSHEIRTPMNAVVGITNLLIQQSHSEEQKEYLHALKTSSDNLLKVLNNVLDLSKLESGKVSFEIINFDIREILSEVQETFKFKAAEKNIQIFNVVSPLIPKYLKGDPLRLHQVLVNLVSNALKFTMEGRIVIKVALYKQINTDYQLLFSVTDSGIGIPSDKLEEIFESFTQASSDISRKFGGTGLGLTITKRLIELQGGNIAVESQINRGSRFIFDLNFSISDEISELPEVTLSYNIEGVHLLLAEDNEMNQLVVRKFLEKEKVHITVVDNGKKAVEIMDKINFDIILMDLQMPEMDGYEATRHIRKTEAIGTDYIPIIALTASSADDIEHKIREAGMTDLITKPFNPGTLFSMISKYTSIKRGKIKSFTPDKLSNKTNYMNYKFINLNYINEASNGNVAFIKNMITIFLKQTPGYLKELQDSFDAKEWDKFKKVIHKMKPTIPMMGIPVSEEVVRIEESVKQMTNLDQVPELLSKLIAACEGSYEELKSELENLG